jgi:hypothetical protein
MLVVVVVVLVLAGVPELAVQALAEPEAQPMRQDLMQLRQTQEAEGAVLEEQESHLQPAVMDPLVL